MFQDHLHKIPYQNYITNSLIDAPLRPLDGRLFIDIGSELTTNQKAALQLHICESKFNFSDATDLSGSYTWNSTSLDWAGVSTRNLILSVPTLPTLTLTLTPASISESDDADTTSKVENRATVAASLSRASTVITTVTISVESADSNDYRLSSNAVLSIPNGALSSLGVVTIEAVDNNEDEADKELTVKGAVTNELGVIGPDDITLTIIDDDNAVPTSANRTVTMDEDTSYTFGSVDFAFTDTDDVLASVKVVTLPAAGSLALDGAAVTANDVVAVADIPKLKYTPPANAHGTGYASFTFKVSDGVSESASANTMTMDVTAVNDPATGLPTISGTARVGQELTADAGGIGDVDGLPALSKFAWQWLRVSGGSDTAIAGATLKTYRVVAADVGAKFKVVVIFTDLDENGELVISAEYPAGTVLANAAPTSADRTVTMDEDTSHTFGSGDFAFTDTDGDGLVSVKVVTLPGSGSLALEGAAVTAGDVVAVADIPKLKYTPPANATGYASFTFKVSDGVSESASANTLTINVMSVNDPATGLPTITGTARAGQELTADASNIMDADGLPEVSTFAWQWLRVSGGSDTAVTNATSKTYRLVAADVGAKFKVVVSFTDLDGNAESLTSAEYPAGTVTANAAPTSADRTVTMDEDTSHTFGSGDFAFTDTDSGDELVSVKVVTLPGSGSLALDGAAVTANDVVAVADIPKLKFTPAANAHGTGYASFTFKVSDWVSESASANTLTINVMPVNDPATGLLTITGTARVGKTLTADAGGIGDVDGLPEVSTFTWQWLRVSGGSDTAIAGATSKTYRVVAADVGAKFKVVVSFTDLDENGELVISAEYPAGTVLANAAPTSSDRTVTMDEDTAYRFGPVDFAFTDTDNGDVLVRVKLVTVPGAGSLTLGGVPVRANQVIGTSDLSRLVFTPAANAHGAGYASFTFKVSDGVSESAAANTLTVDVTAVDDPASGLAITGTVRVGQTLTADTSKIVDADGLTSPNYRYQWVRVDGSTETDLGTASTHVVTSADQGKKLKVEVTLTDDDSNTETLEAETGTVSANAAPTSSNRTVTMDEDTSYTFGSVDFAFTDTDSDDGLASVKVVTLPGSGSLALDGAAVTANDVVAVADISKLKYTPPANAHGTGYASFTFKVNDGVSESAAANTLTVDVTAVDDPASGLAITGTVRVGQTLTADTSKIVDADGLTSPNYRYQWVRVDSGSETDLGTASTHVVASADQGKKLKVEVTLTDDDSNTATLEAETGTVSANAAPTSSNRTVTMDEDTAYRFGSVDFAFTDTDSGDELVSVKVVTLPGSGSLALSGVPVTAGQVIGTSDLGRLRFTSPANAHGTGYASFTFKVSDGVSESASANTMTINVTAVDDPASGLDITGTVRVGQTLTADTSKIVDADGLTSPNYRYQWVRVDGSTETNLGTASTHVVTTADEGKKLKVEVTLTDDDSNTATLEAETGTVSDNAAPTSADRTVTTDEDTEYPFTSADFAFTDTDSGDGLVSVKVVTLPGSGSLALGGVAVMAGQVIGTSDLGRLRYTPVANAHGSGYASFTFKVSDGVSESASANTMTINVMAVDDPASGLDITGTIRVGQTLTADTSKIVDADGLTSPNYRYQWVRVDGSTETNLGTASTHVVTTADEGKKLKVEVTLTDDDSNTATLEAETGTVSDNAAPTSSNRTVTMDEDTEYPFTSADFAFTDTDSGDGLVSVKVVTLPAAGSLALGGVAVTANDVVAVADIPRLRYTPVANAHGSGYASFTFKVSDGVSESASANTMTINVTAVDDPASGLAITGTIRVGQTLTADTSKIVDADGLTSPNYRYQWVRVDGSTETDLGTASTHVVTTTDQGKKLKVEVTLTDDDSNTATLEAETGAVSDNAAPTSSNRTVTTDEDTEYPFTSADFAFTDTDSGDGLVSVKVVTLPAAGSLALDGAAVTAGQVIGTSDLGRLRYTPVANAHGSGYASFTFKVSDGVSESASANTMTINVTAVDDPASGLDITGTIRVGQTLTADTSKIVDADGLTSPNYRYQWVRVDGSTETDLGTASTHVVTTTDQGKKLKVEVTLTDDDSNTATLEAETRTVSDNAAPTSSNRTVTMDEDTEYPFTSADFAFTDTDSGDGLVSVKVVTLPAAGSLALGGVAVTAGQVIGTSDLGRLRFTPVTNAHGTGYASFTFKVSDGVSESASVNTMTIDVTAVDDPASGLAITGTVRVGQTLTADTSKIVDADGLTNPNYRYQWIRVDGSTETDLGTASTHVVTTADEGKKLKVEVTLTDDDSNTETLEAETGGTVSDNAAPTSADRTVTMDEDTSYMFGSVDFAFADADSGDGLVSVKVVTLPGVGSLALGGVAVTANDVVAVADIPRLRFTPVTNAHGTGYASFTFKVSDGVSESASANTMTMDVTAVDDPASGLAITGTVRVGQTLTADTSKIVDADGLTNPNYRYQWVRVDGSTETDLGTASTHVVTTVDEGKKLKVEVTLTDDDSNTETLEAETGGTVSDNAAPTSADRTVTMDEDTSYTFGSVDFAFVDTDSGDGLVSVKVVTLPGVGSLALGGVAVTANDVVAVADIPRLRFTPVTNAHGTGYASFTFKVSDGVSESASANTMTMDVTAVDDPASGLAITGTVRVGQTLTADTSKIVDADGLTSPNYRYQWVRVDGSTETDLGTASTHVVTTADQGKKLKVEVTLTDDDSNTATLEAETGMVLGAVGVTLAVNPDEIGEESPPTRGCKENCVNGHPL